MVNPATCNLYELWDAQYNSSGSTAGSGAIWNLDSNALRPPDGHRPTPRGLPICQGSSATTRCSQAPSPHAIRMTAETTDTSYLWPARHEAGTGPIRTPTHGGPLPSEGQLRHLGLFATSPGGATAMQQYGPDPGRQRLQLVLRRTADNGWPAALVDELKKVPASAFRGGSTSRH